MKKTICNICGKKFDMWDQQEGFGLHYQVGYAVSLTVITSILIRLL